MKLLNNTVVEKAGRRWRYVVNGSCAGYAKTYEAAVIAGLKEARKIWVR